MVEPYGVDRVADHDREIRVIKRMLMDLEERLRTPPGGADVKEQARFRQDLEAMKSLVDQISSREGVTLHRLETLKERVDEVAALGAEVGELKKRTGSPGTGPAGVPVELLTALQEGVQEVRQQLEVLRAGQAAQTKRLDGLKEENLKLRSEFRQLEAQAHGALEALQQQEVRLERRLGSVEQSRPAPPPAPPRAAIPRSSLNALRKRAARVAELSDQADDP